MTNDPQGIGTTTVNGINDRGQLVGFFVDGNDATEGFVATLPEPASCGFVAFGLFAALLGSKKRNSR